MRKIIKSCFSTTVDVLSTKNLKQFGVNDYPNALLFSRPFRILNDI
jgi:hypothetical protein